MSDHFAQFRTEAEFSEVAVAAFARAARQSRPNLVPYREIVAQILFALRPNENASAVRSDAEKIDVSQDGYSNRPPRTPLDDLPDARKMFVFVSSLVAKGIVYTRYEKTSFSNAPVRIGYVGVTERGWRLVDAGS